MTQFLKKYAKPMYIVYGVFCFLFIVIACIYITPYKKTLLQFTREIYTTQLPDFQNSDLFAFCTETGNDFNDYFFKMFYFNNDLQLVNNLMLTLGVVSLVMFAAMLICSNATRKKYYISNLVSGVVGPAVNIILAVVVLVLNFACVGPLNENYDLLNWGALANNSNIGSSKVIEWYQNGDKSHFTMNSTPLIIYGVILIIFILVSGALLAYNVYRYLDTKKELSQQAKVVGE